MKEGGRRQDARDTNSSTYIFFFLNNLVNVYQIIIFISF